MTTKELATTKTIKEKMPKKLAIDTNDIECDPEMQNTERKHIEIKLKKAASPLSISVGPPNTPSFNQGIAIESKKRVPSPFNSRYSKFYEEDM